MISMVLISLFFFTLFQINNLTRETDFLRTLQQQLRAISQENEKLRATVVGQNNNTLAEILIAELDLVRTEKIYFIRVPAKQVVVPAPMSPR